MSRLGRNPFDKKPAHKPERTPTRAPARAIDIMREADLPEMDPGTEPRFSRVARFLMVDLPAESYVFGLKALLLSLSILD